MKAQADYGALEKRWGEWRSKNEHELYAVPPKVSAKDVIVFLEYANATAPRGDSRFAAAIEAIREHGFEQTGWGKSGDGIYVRRMNWHVKRGRSVRMAAAKTAVAFCVHGATFNAVVKRLENAFREEEKKWQTEGEEL